MNTLVPEPEIPSHQGPDAQSVDPELDVVTMAVKVPETLAHLHYWSVQLTRAADREEVLAAFRSSSRIALIRMSDGLTAINTVKELTPTSGGPTTTSTRWRSSVSGSHSCVGRGEQGGDERNGSVRLWVSMGSPQRSPRPRDVLARGRPRMGRAAHGNQP
jgi:hypothetical protein